MFSLIQFPINISKFSVPAQETLPACMMLDALCLRGRGTLGAQKFGVLHDKLKSYTWFPSHSIKGKPISCLKESGHV